MEMVDGVATVPILGAHAHALVLLHPLPHSWATLCLGCSCVFPPVSRSPGKHLFSFRMQHQLLLCAGRKVCPFFGASIQNHRLHSHTWARPFSCMYLLASDPWGEGFVLFTFVSPVLSIEPDISRCPIIQSYALAEKPR